MSSKTEKGVKWYKMSHNPAYLPYMTNSLAIRQEIQRFESVHPSIYAIYDLIELVPDPLLAQQIREHVVCIEGKKESTKLGLSRLLAALGSFKFVLHIKISSFRHVWIILMVEGCFSVTTTENMAFFLLRGKGGCIGSLILCGDRWGTENHSAGTDIPYYHLCSNYLVGTALF